MRLAAPLVRVRDAALDAVFPRRCVGCSGFGAFLCGDCLSNATPAVGPRCPVCWTPAPGTPEGQTEDACIRCRAAQPAFAGTRSAFVYEGAVRDAVLALKFAGVSAIAPELGRLMAGRLADWAPPVQAIVPVPLATGRLRERGYNQSDLFAREVSRVSGLPLLRGALVRRRGSTPNAQAIGREERRANVTGAFTAGRSPAGGTVLLVDDVMTTGATLDACARVLFGAGADAVFALTFARED